MSSCNPLPFIHPFFHSSFNADIGPFYMLTRNHIPGNNLDENFPLTIKEILLPLKIIMFYSLCNGSHPVGHNSLVCFKLWERLAYNFISMFPKYCCFFWVCRKWLWCLTDGLYRERYNLQLVLKIMFTRTSKTLADDIYENEVRGVNSSTQITVLKGNVVNTKILNHQHLPNAWLNKCVVCWMSNLL